MLKNRQEAGDKLAAILKELEYPDPIVLALPRGGVVVADPIATELRAPLDVFITKKIVTPQNRETAIGAVSETGDIYTFPLLIAQLDISPKTLSIARDLARLEVKRFVKTYRGDRPLINVEGKTVIAVDDGVATGANFYAFVKALQNRNPAQIVAAAPVWSDNAAELIEKEVNNLIKIPGISSAFLFIGQQYENFSEVPESTVKEILARHRTRE